MATADLVLPRLPSTTPVSGERELELIFEADAGQLPADQSPLSTEHDPNALSVLSIADNRAQAYADHPPWSDPLGQAAMRGFLAQNGQPLIADGGYHGEEPFYLKEPGGAVWGPCSLAQIERYLAVDAHRATQLAISTDHEDWLETWRFGLLTGQEHLIGSNRELPAKPAFEGELRKRSLASVLAYLRSRVASGILVVIGDRSTPMGSRREIHVSNGRPTFVYADIKPLSIPALLVKHKLLQKDLVEQVVHATLALREFVDRVASRVAGIDVKQYWPLVMRDRLAEVFEWKAGRFAFDPTANPRFQPFAKSLLSILVEMVSRSVPEYDLRQALSADLEFSMRPSERLSDLLPELSFTERQAGLAEPLIEGKSVSSLLKRYPDEVRQILIVAYVLIEAGLLLRPIDKG
jgi:hypothetical protein